LLAAGLATARLTAAEGQTVPADCAPLKSGALPAWPDGADTTKRLTDCGYALTRDGNYQRALIVFDAALAMARRRADSKSEAAALDGSGLSLGRTGHPDLAEARLLESYRISEMLKDDDGMAEASSQLGHIRTMQARYGEARELHQRSYELWKAAGAAHGMAVALNNVGSAYRSQGDVAHAADYYQRSLDGLQALGDQRSSATVIDNLARVSRALGDFDRALTLSQQALAIRRGFNDREGIARSWTSLSENYRAQGNYAAAIEALRKSLDLFTEVGVVHSIAETLNNIAAAYEMDGDSTRAADYLRRALALNRAKVGSPSLSAEIAWHLGEVLLAEDRPLQARREVVHSLAISAAGGFAPQAADARLVLARIDVRLGRLDSAAVELGKVLAFRTSDADRAGRVDALIDLAGVERRRRHLTDGLGDIAEAITMAEAMELTDVQGLALTELGRLEMARGRRAEARAAFDRAIASVETVRGLNAGGEDTRSRLFAERLAPYHERLALALADHDTGGAFALAERSKARALLDTIRGDSQVIRTAMTDAETGRERTLRTTLASSSSELRTAAAAVPRDDARVAALKKGRDQRRVEYEDFEQGLYVAHPRLRIDRASAPIATPTEAASLLDGPSAAIVEYVVGAARTHAFVVTSAGIRAVSLPATSTAIMALVGEFRERLAARDLRADDSGRRLYDAVIAPIRPLLHATTSVIVIPDGGLWNLPFQALRAPDARYLVEDMAVSYAPSVTVLRETRRRQPSAAAEGTFMALGNPAAGQAATDDGAGHGWAPLPAAEEEVARLGRLYGPASRVYTGAAAREDRWKAEAPNYRILHIAAHGVLDNASPLYSHLVLAAPAPGDQEDGLLEAWEIMNIRLAADLVVLSACETARGRIAPGEGVIGLMWAVFVAGTPATLVSQWPVDAASTTQLMVGFHTEWDGGRRGVSKARALQRASLSVLHSPGRAHPFYWAGFILAGDAR
jgi:CHAT domain-containing protein/tetratricopeptide (TPR) repeat protein